MDFDIFIGSDKYELRGIEKAKLNLTYKTENKKIRPQTLRGGVILGTHAISDGDYEDSKVVYILDDGKILEKQGTLVVADDQIAF